MITNRDGGDVFMAESSERALVLPSVMLLITFRGSEDVVALTPLNRLKSP